MATSLAQQLKKLAAPQTQRLRPDYVTASLLLEPRQASQLERDDFYAIGLTGLDELEVLLPAFSRFHKTLFSESSKLLERSVQTPEVNDKLNREISYFMYMVSPFLLLKPALKALEWLVNRYQVHLYNVDDLMKCALPYHETNVFVRVLQLLDLKGPPNRWTWLLPNQKSGVHLAALTLYNHCASEIGFFEFVCRTAQDFAKCLPLSQPGLLRPVMLFYLSTVIGVLERSKTVSEALLTTILSHVVRGLKSHLDDYVAASYIVLVHLVHKTGVQPSILEPLVTVMLKAAADGFQDEAVQCLNAVMETQSLVRLGVVARRALRTPEMTDAIVELSQRCDVQRVVRVVARGLLALAMKKEDAAGRQPATVKRRMKEAATFVGHVRLADAEVAAIVQFVLKTFLKTHTPGDSRLAKFSRKLLTVLEKRHPVAFDEALEDGLRKLDVRQRKVVRRLICGPRAKHMLLLPDGIVGSFLASLNHPNPMRRKLAVEMLESEFGSLDLSAEDLTSMVLARLGDDDAEVVNAVLDADNLINSVVPSDLVPVLLDIVSRRKLKKNWLSVRHKALDVLSTPAVRAGGSADRLLSVVLPLLFPTSMKELKMAKRIARRDILAAHPLFEPLWKDLKGALLTAESLPGVARGHSLLLDAVCGNLSVTDAVLKAQLLKLLTDMGRTGSSYPHFHLVLVPYLSAEIVASETDPEERQRLAQTVTEFIASRLDDCSGADQKTDLDWSSVVTAYTTLSFLEVVGYAKSRLAARSAALGSLVFCLAKTARGIPYERSGDGLRSYQLQSTLFKLITHWINVPRRVLATDQPYRVFFRYWIQACFRDEATWMAFLLRLIDEGLAASGAVACSRSDPYVLQVRSLRLLTATVRSVRSTRQGDAVASLSDAFPVLLVLAGSQAESVRSSALDCLDSLADGGWMEPRFLNLLQGVLNYRMEIQIDRRTLKTVLAGFVPKKRPIRKHPGPRRPGMGEQCLDVVLAWIEDNSVADAVKDRLLEYLEDVQCSDVLCDLLPFLDTVLKADDSTRSGALHSAACRIVRMFTPSTVAVFRDSPMAEDVLMQVLRQRPPTSTPTLQAVALGQLTKDWFRALPRAGLRQNVLSTLIDLQLQCTDAVLVRTIARTLRRLLSDGKQIAHELQDGTNLFGDMSKSVKEVKGRKSRTKTPPSQDDNADPEAARKRMLVILEAVQGKRHLTNCAVLIPVLFAHLKRCLEMSGSTDYDQQLLLVCLLKCCTHLSESEDPTQVILVQSQFNIELVIQCIRSTSNPRIHHHALLLLADLAKLFPEYVLHNAMSIFTFMGANMLRHDDSYSFNVITKTVGSIVPAILENRRAAGDSTEELQLVTSLTRIFVDALPDVPEHRRIPLFDCYLTALGTTDHLWLIVAIILQRYATWDHRAVAPTAQKGVASANQDRRALMDFARHFCHGHRPEEQVAAGNRLIGHIVSVSDVEPEGDPSDDELYVQLYSVRQRHHYMLLIVEFVSTLLSSDRFLNQLVEKVSDVDRSMYESLLRRVLECLHRFLTSSKTDAGKGNQSTAKYWKLVIHRTYELLDKVASLVPEETFVDVVRTLMTEHNMSIQCKAIEMLIAKLQRQADHLEVESYVRIVPDLLSVLRSDAVGEEWTPSDLIYNKQMTLLALKLMIRSLAGTHPDPFKEVLKMTIELTCDAAVHEHLRSSTLLCLAELCQTLQTDVIAHLPRILPAVLSIMDDVDRISKNELLLLSVVTAVHRIVESFSHFLSPYLQSIIMKVCRLSTFCSDIPKSPLNTRLKAIRQNLAQDISLRLLLPAIRSCYDEAVNRCPDAIQPLAVTLGEAIRIADQNAAIWHHVLFDFFLTALDYRSQHPLESEERIRNVEGWIVEPLLTFVVKMSETTFRPFFIKLFDWATRDGVPSERALVFYFVANRIADRLKSLFVLFAGHFIRNAAALLDRNNTSKIEAPSVGHLGSSCQGLLLVGHVLDCLHKCFLYDNEGFLNQERFDTLLDPLVDQIENGADDVDDEAYDRHIGHHLTPCIGQFAVAASNDSFWKSLGYRVLLKTRHADAKVRFSALQVTREIARKLGEEFITLLPETIPFLAELMEDESVEVEKLCQDVIADMEVIIGEPLQKYFLS